MKKMIAMALSTGMVLASLGCPPGDTPATGGGDGTGTDKAPAFILAWSEYPSWSTFGVADEVGLNLGVLVDFFHVNIEDGPVPETICVAGDKLKHVHLADSNRQAPGTGHIDWVETVRTLNLIGFDGYLSVDSVPVRPDWKTLLREAIDFMKNIEHVVELQESIDGQMQRQA